MVSSKKLFASTLGDKGLYTKTCNMLTYV